ncbi:MAG: hypothetical protein ACRD42_03315, partial [Nitrososphaeraceae archaeon]
FMCALSQIIYLKIIKRGYSLSPLIGNFRKNANITHLVVSSAQYFIIACLIVTLVEIAILKKYDTFTVRILTLSSLFLSVGLLSVLAFRFLRWVRNRPDYLVIVYTAATIMIAANSLFVALFISLEMQDVNSVISSSRAAISSGNVSNFELKEFQANLSLVPFVLFWIASTLLLRQYKRKWGAIKFYTILIIPLLYYFGIFQLILSNVFIQYDILNTFQIYTFNVVNSILTRPVGGILFGIAFWIIARKINERNISGYMKFAALGIMLLSISNEDAGLYLLPYPPFGLPTITFVGISSYLLLVGIYYSAISTSQDNKIRSLIKKSVEEQLKFVSEIGTSQMEQEIQSKVKDLTRRSAKKLEEDSGIEIPMQTQEMDEYIKTAIHEVQKITKGKNG